MNGKLLLTILIIVSVGALVAGCTGSSPSPSPTAGVSATPGAVEPKGTITLSGAFALYPMAQVWAEEYQKLHPGVKIEVSAGGAGKGMADALGGLVDIGMVSRDVNSSELSLGAYPIGVTKDAVIGVVNKNNPVYADIQKNGINQSVLTAIYINGTVKTWGEVVGKPEIKDEIHVYTRSDSSGAADIWAKYLGNKKQDNLKGIGVNSDPGLLAQVQKDPLGIGYNNYNYVYDNQTGLPVSDIGVVPFVVNRSAIDLTSKDKTIAAIKGGVFPHPPARVELFVTKGKPTGVTADFIKWVLTDGQKYVDSAGFIPLSPDAIDTELKKVS